MILYLIYFLDASGRHRIALKKMFFLFNLMFTSHRSCIFTFLSLVDHTFCTMASMIKIERTAVVNRYEDRFHVSFVGNIEGIRDNHPLPWNVTVQAWSHST